MSYILIKSTMPQILREITWGICALSTFVFAVTIFLISSLLLSCGDERGDSKEDSVALLVNTVEAEMIPEYTIAQTYVGEVEAARKSRLGFEIGGMVFKVVVDEGDFVKESQVLAELDTERLKARRRELTATRDQAHANLELAQITRQRTKEALDLNAVSIQDYDEADKGYKAQLASVNQAEAAIKTIDVDIGKSKLKAPFNAVISKRFLDEGEVIPSGEPVFEILERTNLEVRVGLAGAAVDGIKTGDTIIVIVNDREYDSKVKSVLPVRSQNTRTVDIILTLDKEFDGLRDGELATVAIDKSILKEGFWLPLFSLTESSRGLWSCYVAVPLDEQETDRGATHRIERRELELLHQESEQVFVQGTVSEGDLVVTEGLQRLVPGLLVNIENRTSISGNIK